jgi:Zn-finger nucleic acid-binding protein
MGLTRLRFRQTTNKGRDMTCPKCGGDMRRYERNSVDIDQCTECRGIFLDRGELERLVDAESGYHAKHEKHDREHRSEGGHKPRRKQSFLSELFD